MNDPRPSDDLVMTQAQLPPGIDAPAPPNANSAATAGSTRNDAAPADVVRELRQLADRVGGFAQLKALVDELAATAR